MTIRQGTVVLEFDPHWRVVDRGPEHKRVKRHVVIDTSVEPPQQVYGPTTKSECESYCRVQVGLWRAVNGQGEWT